MGLAEPSPQPSGGAGAPDPGIIHREDPVALQHRPKGSRAVDLAGVNSQAQFREPAGEPIAEISIGRPILVRHVEVLDGLNVMSQHLHQAPS